MHYKITIFGACAPNSRLIYWTALSISQKKNMTYHQNPGPGNMQNIKNVFVQDEIKMRIVIAKKAFNRKKYHSWQAS